MSITNVQFQVRTALLAVLGVLGLVVPSIASAADSLASTNDIQAFIGNIGIILNILLPILVTLALLAFFWGLVKYLWSAGDEKARDAGKGLMIWGVIALFVMVSVWGLVAVIGDLFGVEQGQSAPVPNVSDQTGGTGVGGGTGGNGGNGGNNGGTIPPGPGGTPA